MKRVVLVIAVLMLAFTGCKTDNGNTEAKDVAIDDILAVAKEKMNTEPMMEADGELLEALTEIKQDDIDELRYYAGSTNLFVSSIMIIKPKADKFDDVKKSVASFLENETELYKTYLEEQYQLLKKAELTTNGEYVILLVGEGAAEAKNEIDKLFE